MKLYDQKTMDLAQAVQDVLEGKKVVKEMKYPHDMFDPKTGKKEVANNEAEHNALEKKGYTHEAPKENVGGPADLSVNQNVKKVQDRHGAVKKVDLTPESVQEAHEEALAIEEARQLKDPKKEVMVVKNGKVEVIDKKDIKKYVMKGYGLAEDTITISLPISEKKATIDLDFADGDMKKIERKYKVKYKKRRDGGFDVTGDTKALQKLLKGDEYAYDKDDIEDMFPEVLEAKSLNRPQTDAEKKAAKDKFMRSADKLRKRDEKERQARFARHRNEDSDQDMDEAEMSAKQAAYKKVFDAAMKKFGVKSPAELEDGKKKEFFDYVDANYEADGEVKEGVGDFFNKAKKKVQRAADKVTGGDSSGDKAKAAINKQLDELELKVDRAESGLEIAEKKFKDKEIDKKKMDELDDYYNTIIYKAETKMDELNDKLKDMDGDRKAFQ